MHNEQMYTLIDAFADQLKEAMAIGQSANLKPSDRNITSVVITGLGGSGIGGKIVSQLVAGEAKVPFTLYSNYDLPAHVGPSTLVIASSYSGNTEETLGALEDALAKGAEVACITSGGKVLEICQEKGLNHIVIPGGNPPRTMLAYSLTQQFYLLKNYGIISNNFEADLEATQLRCANDKDEIKSAAKELTDKLHGKRVVIYSEAEYEGVGVRFRQQLNENSKELCWHHVFPEMNHNELVGWGGGSDVISVVLFRNEDDNSRSQVRMDLSKGIWARYTPHVTEVWSKGDSMIEKSLYLILLGDWVSYYLAEKKGVDPIEIEVINYLKGELAKV